VPASRKRDDDDPTTPTNKRDSRNIEKERDTSVGQEHERPEEVKVAEGCEACDGKVSAGMTGASKRDNQRESKRER